ncbi:hypothetical protein FB468_0873 [Leucobacter komagatae]|uniref:Uncharacterized protein n=1 Tax=Leucobacter komagatae TaxID=55969 RepID=A0A542Y462_9MICO|nr:hypothetical protein [Leucobacter komagatae]TQL42864.1 hypothetical protein FB468_0873 [Leucobacter komagatae]
MLISLWMMAQFVLLTLVVAFGAAQPQSPAQLLLLGAASLLALAPMLTAAVGRRRAPLATPVTPPAALPRRAALRTFVLPADPGTPGSAFARAPSFVA